MGVKTLPGYLTTRRVLFLGLPDHAPSCPIPQLTHRRLRRKTSKHCHFRTRCSSESALCCSSHDEREEASSDFIEKELFVSDLHIMYIPFNEQLSSGSSNTDTESEEEENNQKSSDHLDTPYDLRCFIPPNENDPI
ncbi:hypothetical protein J6590_048529 [Homalodisca vitripennis]|nr:hypothetical protein J6590_048529 [Homalodisca vitripennis]